MWSTHTHARTFRLFTSVSMPMINELMAMNNIKILANASDTWEWFFASYFCIAHTLHCLVTEWLFWYEQHTRACGATATTLALMPEQISVPFVKARRTKEQAAVLFVRNPCFLCWRDGGKHRISKHFEIYAKLQISSLQSFFHRNKEKNQSVWLHCFPVADLNFHRKYFYCAKVMFRLQTKSTNSRQKMWNFSFPRNQTKNGESAIFFPNFGRSLVFSHPYFAMQTY